MADEVTVQIVVRDPHPEVTLRMQRGRMELVSPVRTSAETVTFELGVQVVTRAEGTIVLKGPQVQGPPASRFVYVNAGQYAGGAPSPWSRRAKIPLGGITQALIQAVRATPGAVLRAEIYGRARDGGPAAATVPLLGAGWTVASGEA
jgi:Family of unknown function (DUF5990)